MVAGTWKRATGLWPALVSLGPTAVGDGVRLDASFPGAEGLGGEVRDGLRTHVVGGDGIHPSKGPRFGAPGAFDYRGGSGPSCTIEANSRGNDKGAS
jgi:hypothetical protein